MRELNQKIVENIIKNHPLLKKKVFLDLIRKVSLSLFYPLSLNFISSSSFSFRFFCLSSSFLNCSFEVSVFQQCRVQQSCVVVVVIFPIENACLYTSVYLFIISSSLVLIKAQLSMVITPIPQHLRGTLQRLTHSCLSHLLVR